MVLFFVTKYVENSRSKSVSVFTYRHQRRHTKQIFTQQNLKDYKVLTYFFKIWPSRKRKIRESFVIIGAINNSFSALLLPQMTSKQVILVQIRVGLTSIKLLSGSNEFEWGKCRQNSIYYKENIYGRGRRITMINWNLLLSNWNIPPLA